MANKVDRYKHSILVCNLQLHSLQFSTEQGACLYQDLINFQYSTQVFPNSLWWCHCRPRPAPYDKLHRKTKIKCLKTDKTDAPKQTDYENHSDSQILALHQLCSSRADPELGQHQQQMMLHYSANTARISSTFFNPFPSPYQPPPSFMAARPLAMRHNPSFAGIPSLTPPVIHREALCSVSPLDPAALSAAFLLGAAWAAASPQGSTCGASPALAHR